MNTGFLLFALHLPERRMFNEYYARDTSRKIRSTFQSKGKSGKHLTGTVIYGYLWNEARDQWLVDPEAADVVKRIFAMTIDGYGPYQVASKLKEEKILIPSAYLAQHGEGVNKNKTFKVNITGNEIQERERWKK